MSHVLLLAADKPLPLCDCQEERTSVITFDGKTHTISFVRGFRLSEHSYYRHCTDELGFPIKPYQYELAIELHETDLRNLQDYLAQHFAHGEEVELWSIWLSPSFDSYGICPPHYWGALDDFDMAALEQLLSPHKPSQCWLTITI